MISQKTATAVVKKVEIEDSEKVMEFMIRLRRELFPMLAQSELPTDIVNFEQHYIQREDAAAYAAFSPDGEVLGTIAVSPYNGRFDQLLEYSGQIRTAEIVKCYMDQKYRRLGIGTKLFTEAIQFSRDAGYQKLYLHSHPFLPGGIAFWKSRGFLERHQEDTPIWETMHMEMNL